MLTVEQLGRLAEVIGGRYQALVLLATFANLRWGELAALTHRHVDLDACTVRVISSLTETDSGTLFPGPPKSAAGRRGGAVQKVESARLRHGRQRETGKPPATVKPDAGSKAAAGYAANHSCQEPLGSVIAMLLPLHSWCRVPSIREVLSTSGEDRYSVSRQIPAAM